MQMKMIQTGIEQLEKAKNKDEFMAAFASLQKMGN